MAQSEQKAQKAFGLRDSRDLLKKLKWELNNLFFRQRHDVETFQYHSFNCAVTAWHAIDWLWLDVSAEVRDSLGQIIKRPKCGFRAFQAYVRETCPSLRLCEKIANGSKHCLLTRDPDPMVSANISEGEGYDYGNPIIVEGETTHMADDVFRDALFWLEAFVREWNIFPEEPFVPSGN